MEEKTEEKIEEKKPLKLPIWLVILIAFLGGIVLLYASMALYAKMDQNRRMRVIQMPINEYNKMLLAKLKKSRIPKKMEKAQPEFRNRDIRFNPVI